MKSKTNILDEYSEDDLFFQFLISTFKKAGTTDINVNDPSFVQKMIKPFIQNAPIGMFVLENSRFSYVNNRFSDSLGYSGKEIIVKKDFIQKLIHPEDFPIVHESIRRKMNNEAPANRYRVRALKKNGELIHIEIHINES